MLVPEHYSLWVRNMTVQIIRKEVLIDFLNVISSNEPWSVHQIFFGLNCVGHLHWSRLLSSVTQWCFFGQWATEDERKLLLKTVSKIGTKWLAKDLTELVTAQLPRIIILTVLLMV